METNMWTLLVLQGSSTLIHFNEHGIRVPHTCDSPPARKGEGNRFLNSNPVFDIETERGKSMDTFTALNGDVVCNENNHVNVQMHAKFANQKIII